MKNIYKLLVCVSALTSLFSCGGSTAQYAQNLERGFVNIPDSIQTSVYWYWMGGFASKEGVVRDLQAMKEVGINRAFIGNIAYPEDYLQAKGGLVEFQSKEWWELMHLALKTATELDIEIGIFNSPGWSQSGGPWVKSEQSMRYLASTMTEVKGGENLNIELPRPLPPHNPDLDYKAVFQDVKVIAFPKIGDSNSILNSSNCNITASRGVSNAKNLLDGDYSTLATLAPSGRAAQKVTLDFVAKSDFTLRSVKVYPNMEPIKTPIEIQVKESGKYKTVVASEINRYKFGLNVGFDPDAPVVIGVPAIRGKEFRIVINSVDGGAQLRQVELSSIPFVESFPEKSLAKVYQEPLPYWDKYLWPAQYALDDKSLAVDPAQVIDLSDKLQGDRLICEALPQGNWVIQRAGMYPTGVNNSPSEPIATGLEIDKMSKEHIRSHFDAYLGELLKRIPAKDRKTWKVVVQDSYEKGAQNFTDGFLEEFEDVYGYDPLPFLPVYEGVVVGSQDISDRFLWDIRRLIANKVAYDYVAGLREVSHENGLTTWLENYGHFGFPSEFLMYGSQSDEIAGEFWSEGSLGDIENRAATSCAHIYNKQKVSAESFTAGYRVFQRVPADMKQRGDRFSAEGINNTLLHLYIQQPFVDRLPGVNAIFGNEFNRNNTWFSDLKNMNDYFKRCNYMLQQGLNVADVAYFIGEDAPKMTGVLDPALPQGYQFDYMNGEVIVRDMYLKDGLFTLPHGTQYKLLVLPQLTSIRPEVLNKIKSLIEDGGVVLGPRPTQSPSYQDYPNADAQIQCVANSLWGKIDPQTKYAKIGKGIIAEGMSVAEVLSLRDVKPDFALASGENVHYGHRTNKGVEIYFVSNQEGKPISITPEFRVKGLQPEAWNAINGNVRELPAFELTQTGVVVPLKLDINESVFVVFSKKAAKALSNSIDDNYPQATTLDDLDTPWTLTFKKDFDKRGPEEPIILDELIDISTHEDYDTKHYAGTIGYANSFTLEETPVDKNLILNLGYVTAAAKVYINNKYVGGVWTYPYSIDITDFVEAGENKIDVDVSTIWHNRVIGDVALPENERQTWSVFQPYGVGTRLFPAGMIGPVVVESVVYKE